jgi:hypothetical protein
MANLDPWSYAEKTRNEYAEQVALFMWANMACNFGLQAANDPLSYSVPGYAKNLVAPAGSGLVPQLKWLHAIKNAGHGDAVRGAMSKAEGVKAGVPDICLPVRKLFTHPEDPDGRTVVKASALYIELKRLKSARGAAGSTSEVQDEWREYLTQAGYAVEVCHGWEAARDAILRYLGLTQAYA